MINILLSLLIIFFTKEFIVINQEIIIYCTFLSLMLLSIKTFSSLESVFENIRSNEKLTLNINSKTEKTTAELTIQKLFLNASITPLFDTDLPQP
jgi:hypothetical protein